MAGGSLPPGFDPRHMTLVTPLTAPSIPSSPNYIRPTNASRVRTSSFVRRSNSIWNNIDWAISRFGNWLDNVPPFIMKWLPVIVILGSWLWALVYVFSADSIFYGILRAIGAFFVIGIASWLSEFVSVVIGLIFKGIRFCFWNTWTLLLTIVVVGSLCMYNSCDSAPTSSIPSTEWTQNQTRVEPDTYVCTAKVLNVRSLPTTESNIRGTIRKNDRVEVYEIVNGFARIKYQGQNGYVSTKYLRRE